MKRLMLLLLVLSLCSFLGCPGGEEEAVDGAGEAVPATNGAAETGPRKQFKEGIDSGRAEDGSDEDK